LAVAACKDDSGITEVGPPAPAALVRFINAGVDTGTVDLRFPDRVENLPTMLGVAFRATSGGYQRVGAGTREVRVFPYSTNINLTSIRLVDTTVPLQADVRYTMVYAGRARAGAPAAESHRLAIIEDPAAPTPPAGQIAIKALHTAVGTGNVDVYVVAVASATEATPANFVTNNVAVLRNVPYLAQSAYVNVPVRPATAGALYRLVVTAAGSTTPVFAVTPNQPGAVSTVPTVGPQPGVQIGGSVLTAVIAPGATPGTREAVATGATANITPTAFLLVDKVLNP
jgi:hypothetical protein